MKHTIWYRIIGILCIVVSSVACRENTLNIPESAKSLEGAYVAKTLDGPFLVNGQSAQLFVKRVTADSVTITLQAYSNGQITDSLSYGKTLVAKEITTSNVRNVCVGYRIKLSPKRENDELVMTCSEENVFVYRYAVTSGGQPVFKLVKFNRL